MWTISSTDTSWGHQRFIWHIAKSGSLSNDFKMNMCILRHDFQHMRWLKQHCLRYKIKSVQRKCIIKPCLFLYTPAYLFCTMTLFGLFFKGGICSQAVNVLDVPVMLQLSCPKRRPFGMLGTRIAPFRLA